MRRRRSSVRSDAIWRVRAGTAERHRDVLTVEEPLEIRVGTRTLAVTMRTPGHDFELAAGFLSAEGLIAQAGEILRMEHCRETVSPEEEGNVLLVRAAIPAVRLEASRRLLLTTSSCGLCGKGSIESVRQRFAAPRSALRVEAHILRGLPDKLRRAQTAFGKTGGLHAAGIFSPRGRPLVVREDIGRHNAVDKAVGRLFLDGKLPLAESILLVSGRASFEIVQKAVAAGIPIVAAVSAPSSLAVDLARDAGIALIGFLRGEAFNLYAGRRRVSLRENARLRTG